MKEPEPSFPVVPLLAGLATLIGGGTLAWYFTLSDQEQHDADSLTEQAAMELFGLARDQLSPAQAEHVNHLVRRHYAG